MRKSISCNGKPLPIFGCHDNTEVGQFRTDDVGNLYVNLISETHAEQRIRLVCADQALIIRFTFKVYVHRNIGPSSSCVRLPDREFEHLRDFENRISADRLTEIRFDDCHGKDNKGHVIFEKYECPAIFHYEQLTKADVSKKSELPLGSSEMQRMLQLCKTLDADHPNIKPPAHSTVLITAFDGGGEKTYLQLAQELKCKESLIKKRTSTLAAKLGYPSFTDLMSRIHGRDASADIENQDREYAIGIHHKSLLD